MPLLRKQPFVRKAPASDLKPEDEVFYCEATKEVFRDYDDFFQRTILCNSLVWSCSVTGKTNLTYEEAVESERKAKKRLGTLPKPLKRGLLWLADHTQRGKLSDMVDDVWRFASGRYFREEIVEAIVNDQWCDCKVINVIPPSQQEIDKDAEEEREEQLKEESESPSKSKKSKKSFFPPEHLFKYELEEIEPDEDLAAIHTIDAEDMRREKGIYTKEKNLLFLKNVTEMGKNGNYVIKSKTAVKHKVSEIQFTHIFSGPQPVFEITRGKVPSFASKKGGKDEKGKDTKLNKKTGKNQGTLDNWVKGEPSSKKTGPTNNAGPPKVKKQSPAEIEAEMKRIREQNERFKEEMKRRAEEAKKQRLEEKARERERKKEETIMVRKMLAEHKAKRDDLECDDLKELPKAVAVQSKIPNVLFGDFVVLLEFFHGFSDILETLDSFPNGVTFEILENALTNKEEPGGALFDILSFMLGAYFDLQNEEDEEIKLDKSQIATTNANDIDKNILGRDEAIANQIRSATTMARWPMKHQGQTLSEIHMNEWSITEILRLHIASAGAHRHDKCNNWLYQQRGGYRLSDDPGLQFRMDDPQIVEALTTHTVYELNIDEKIKLLNCLMYQILSFATVRDEIDEKFNELREAKEELRQHQIGENKRQRLVEEAVKAKKREEFMQKKEEKLKAQEKENQAKQNKDDKSKTEKLVNGDATDSKEAKKESETPPEVYMTERQRLAIQTQKEKEEKELQKKEEILKSQAHETERVLSDRISDLTAKSGRTFLGRDRAYRRYWVSDSLPGLYVEHDDDLVGDCLPQPTPFNPNATPLDEATALIRVKELLDAREKGKTSEEKSSSDKENDDKLSVSRNSDVTKTYSKKPNNQTVLKQKVLSSTNGSLGVNGEPNVNEINGKDPCLPDTVKSEQISKLESLKAEINENMDSNIDTKIMKPWGICTADAESCVVHSSILPRTHWSYFGTIDEVDNLIDSLNERGIRESELKDKLLNERDRLAKSLKRMSNVSNHLCSDKSSILKQENKSRLINGLQNGDMSEDLYRGNSITAIGNLQLRDQILEMEEKIFIGNLGSLKCRDRVAWAEAIRDGGYDSQCDSLSWGGKSTQDTPFESRLHSEAVSRDPSRPSSPSCVNGDIAENIGTNENSSIRKQLKLVRELASAILQVAQMVDIKYIKAPLGEEEKDKKKRLKEEERRKKELENEENDGISEISATKAELLTPLQDWENSLMGCTSITQLFIHLTTLEASIMWSKSLLNTKCRICRRKNDPDKMLLCDGCDRGHHLYCLKPKLKKIPDDDWYCTECKPKMRIRSPKKKNRKVFEEEDLEDDDDEEEEYEDQDTENGDDTQEEDEDDNEAEDENSENESDVNDVDEDSPPRRRKKPQRAFDPPVKAKKNKHGKYSENDENEEVSKKKGLSQLLLGQRRCATEANERIKNVTQHEIHSGNDSSGPEEPSGERASGRLREKRKNVSSISLQQIAQEAAEMERGGARSKRRRDVDDDLDSMFNPTVLEDLLNQMMKHKDGWPFDRPITKSDAPDYHKIITRPMDLGTVRSGLVRMKYTCNQEVLEDIRLVFSNCWAYNKADAEEYTCGVRLEKYFLREAKKLGLVDGDEGSTAPTELNSSSISSRPPLKKSRRTN